MSQPELPLGLPPAPPTEEAHTWGEWRDLGYHVRKGERCRAHNADGKALFYRSQVDLTTHGYSRAGSAFHSEFPDEEPPDVLDDPGYVDFGDSQ